jgi:hypothetical protein
MSEPVVARFWLALALVTAPAVAWAQGAPAPVVATNPSAATDAALAATSAAQRQVAQVAGERGQIAQRYQEQLASIDRLKKERPSWRRDRELRDHLSESNETATQLAAVTARLTAAQGALGRARRTAVAAIDAELASGAGARAGRLRQIRAGLAPAATPAPERIVVPDGTVDPLADPDELDAQAAALRASERQLQAQIAGLDIEAQDLVSVDELRKQHQRAMELGLRDDDQPQRASAATHTAGASSGASAPAPGIGSPTGGGGGAGGGGAGGGSGAGGGGQTTNLPPTNGDSSPTGDRAAPTDLDTAAVVLGDVVDRATIEGLVRASRSNDPRERAAAARRARDAVAARLEQIRKMRAQIEARARELRGARP